MQEWQIRPGSAPGLLRSTEGRRSSPFSRKEDQDRAPAAHEAAAPW